MKGFLVTATLDIAPDDYNEALENKVYDVAPDCLLSRMLGKTQVEVERVAENAEEVGDELRKSLEDVGLKVAKVETAVYPARLDFTLDLEAADLDAHNSPDGLGAIRKAALENNIEKACGNKAKLRIYDDVTVMLDVACCKGNDPEKVLNELHQALLENGVPVKDAWWTLVFDIEE